MCDVYVAEPDAQAFAIPSCWGQRQAQEALMMAFGPQPKQSVRVPDFSAGGAITLA